MAERRKVKRRHLLYYGRVYDEKAQKQLGYLVDITERGFMVLSEEPFQIGETRRFKLEITSDINERPYLNIAATSIWSEPDISPGRYNTGFEMVDIQSADIEIIQSIIRVYGFRDN